MSIERLALVTDGPIERQDGVQRYTATVGEWMADQGIDVHYFTSGPRSEPYEAHSGTVHTLARTVSMSGNGNEFGAAVFPRRAQRSMDLLREGGFDIAHVQLPDGPFVGARVRRALGRTATAVVGTYHLMPMGKSDEVLLGAVGRLSRHLDRKLDGLTATSGMVAEFASSVTGRACDVVPPPVQLGSVPKTTHTDPVITYTGRLAKRKGVESLLHGYAELANQWSDAPPLQLIGDGPERHRLERITGQLGLQSRVSFLGRLSDDEMVDHLRRSAMAVYPAIGGESFGLVLVEAMRSGVPVIAASNPGYASTLQGHESQLFPPSNPGAFAEAARRVLSLDNAERKELITKQHVTAEQFSLNQVGPALIESYEQAMVSLHAVVE